MRKDYLYSAVVYNETKDILYNTTTKNKSVAARRQVTIG
jgi:hypothetical protein